MVETDGVGTVITPSSTHDAPKSRKKVEVSVHKAFDVVSKVEIIVYCEAEVFSGARCDNSVISKLNHMSWKQVCSEEDRLRFLVREGEVTPKSPLVG